MIPELPVYISVVFILTTFLSLFLFRWAIRNSREHADKANLITLLCAAWLGFQLLPSLSGFYLESTDTLPPRFALLAGPVLLLTITLFVTKVGRKFIDDLPLEQLTYLSVIRIPVEIVLWWLFLNHAIPETLTFEGRNFDILVGISAPIIGYLVFGKKLLGEKALLAWNVVGMLILLNIIFHGVLSAPTPFQQFSFEAPNVGMMYFPFAWLPSFVAPLALFTHLVAIRQLAFNTSRGEFKSATFV